MQGHYAVGVAGVALGLARAMLEDFKILAAEKTPRGPPRLAEDSLPQPDFAHVDAQVGSAEAYRLSVLAEIYGRADDWKIINF